MPQHARAGQRPGDDDLVNIEELVRRYGARPSDYAPVHFGTSGHRGSSLRDSFQDRHVAALTQAIVEQRGAWGASGPIFVGADSHALSACALRTVRAVLAAHAIDARFAPQDTWTPTPVISHTILAWNRDHPNAPADGIILTPSHNPPQDGGFKYNPPTGGPAAPEVTARIEARANALLRDGDEIARVKPADLEIGDAEDMIGRYVRGLDQVVDLDAIRAAGVSIGVDPLGGSALPVWHKIRERWGLDVQILQTTRDPQFAFMHLDHDGVIRMDCSSPFAMQGVVPRADAFDVCVGHDPDADRHGIVTARGVMNPNHFLSLGVEHLLSTRERWPTDARIGRTVVTSMMIDRIARAHGRTVYETPVGFKWFVDGMLDGGLVFGGEESAGASFVDRAGKPWSTDKDGIIMGLLAAEIIATTAKNLDTLWDELVRQFGPVFNGRRDQQAAATVRDAVRNIQPEDIDLKRFANAETTHVSSRARGNQAKIGGLRIDTPDGWVAMRPSGTEDILKIYAESFVSQAHLEVLLDEAERVVRRHVS